MGTMLGLGGGIAALVLAVFGIVLLFLWILLPFAVFGIRKRLDALAEVNDLLLHELRVANYLTKVAHNLREQKDADGTIRVLRP